MLASTSMRRILLVVLAAVAISGCGSTQVAAPGRVGALTGQSASETLSLAATIRSTPRNVTGCATVGVSVRSTGTPTGTLTIQYSNDPPSDTTSDTNWDTYTLSTTPPAFAGSPQTFGLALDNYEFAFIRAKYTQSGGTGTITLVWQIKC